MSLPRHPGPLPRRVRPADGEEAGTLVLLHGRGADEHDLFGLFDVLDPARRLRGITIGAPLALGAGRHWYVVPRVGHPDHDSFHGSYGELTSVLDDEIGVDWERTVVGGFSQGSVMSYAVGLGPDRPRPAGILAMSGFVPTVDGWAPELGGREGLAVMITHGTADPVIDVAFGREARRRLTDAGLDVTYAESPVGHGIDPRVVPRIEAWLADRFSAANS